MVVVGVSLQSFFLFPPLRCSNPTSTKLCPTLKAHIRHIYSGIVIRSSIVKFVLYFTLFFLFFLFSPKNDLEVLETQIYNYEETYLTESPHGNVVRGWGPRPPDENANEVKDSERSVQIRHKK